MIYSIDSAKNSAPDEAKNRVNHAKKTYHMGINIDIVFPSTFRGQLFSIIQLIQFNSINLDRNKIYFNDCFSAADLRHIYNTCYGFHGDKPDE